MYKCEHFDIHELVPPNVFRARGEKAWQLLDVRALQTLDALRKAYGQITVNDYHWGGVRKESGLRTPTCHYYRPYSQHSFGRAFDCIFHEYDVDAVRQDILTEAVNLPHIRGIELDVSWLHFDCRNSDRLITFSKP